MWSLRPDVDDILEEFSDVDQKNYPSKITTEVYFHLLLLHFFMLATISAIFECPKVRTFDKILTV